ncbi:MAG TPA: tetratricopeptide repeat protein [Vicinamibacteria bacterium]|nr:tetratricopeptide repeat protein [Vicinamibacteria bacterium]
MTLPPRSRAPSPEAQVLGQVPIRAFEADRCGPGSLSLVLNSYGDMISEAQLGADLPKAPGGGVLSVDLLLAARERGFDAALVPGDGETIRKEIAQKHPSILMLKLLDVPGERKDIYHYVVVDGFDPGRGLFRVQFGDGKVRWTSLARLDRAWRGTSHALLLVHPRRDLGLELRRAVELERAERWTEAATLYREIIAAWPSAARAWVNLGNVEARLDRREESERAYRRALVLSPGLSDALNNLAWLLLSGGSRLEEAEELALEAARETGTDQPVALDTLGRVQLARGRCADAEKTFASALLGADPARGEGRADLLEGLGRAHWACGRAEEARSTLLEALAAGPTTQRSRAIQAALLALERP